MVWLTRDSAILKTQFGRNFGVVLRGMLTSGDVLGRNIWIEYREVLACPNEQAEIGEVEDAAQNSYTEDER